ncbi:DoxX family protein [Desmospora activa]|uniref:Putative membrane protein n=1 Tax=Desmospora activa DSM 45169 TaxID=1121389 RepID=A0A2T4Z945_9BACL|nr:hypothetical protein [Desmospora activa]PTM58413.1 putative membrane protein [Desmospora activa DSM 45169]
MLVLLILLSVYLLLTVIAKVSAGRYFSTAKIRGCYAMCAMLFFTGVSHFVMVEPFVEMIPVWLPYPFWINMGAGVVELLLGLGLLFKRTRKVSGWLLAVFFVLVFPANINNAIYGNEIPGGLNNIPYYPWIRLLFQPVYIVWALWCSKE